MKVATFACVVDSKGGIDKPSRGGKLTFSTIHFPTRRSCHHSGLDTKRQIALADDLPALCIHLKYIPRLRKRFRSSNLLERSLEEVRRRTKVIGRFPGETSCLSLCWAVLDLFLGGAKGLGLSDLEYMQVGPMKIARAHPEQAVTKVA